MIVHEIAVERATGGSLLGEKYWLLDQNLACKFRFSATS